MTFNTNVCPNVGGSQLNLPCRTRTEKIMKRTKKNKNQYTAQKNGPNNNPWESVVREQEKDL